MEAKRDLTSCCSEFSICFLMLFYFCLHFSYVIKINFNIKICNLNITSHTIVGEVKVAQWCPTLCEPMDYTIHGILHARILEWIAFPFSRGSLNPGSKPRSPILQADSLPAVSLRKPKNIEVGSPFLLQGIFLTQESNRGLLYCRWIIYQLSYQGNPLYLGLKPNLGPVLFYF